MNPSIDLITIKQDGVAEVHITNAIGEYATLCGLDGYDTTVGQKIVPTVRPFKISCKDCKAIWAHTRNYKDYHFTRG